MLRSVNPDTGQEIAAYPGLTASEIDGKLACAVSAYARWRVSPLTDRTQLLARLGELYETNKERLAKKMTSEMGKTLVSAIAEVEKCISAFRYFAKNGPAMLEGAKYDLSSGGRAELYWQPIGPVLAVMPWNFPLWQVVRFQAPAILAGNVGLLKHASIVQGTAAMMEEMTLAAGGAEGLFQNLALKSDEIAGVIADRRVMAVTLTGSEAAGVAVAAEAGRHLKKSVLELGGSDPFIVMPSANLDEAVKQAVKARIQNTGQSCICGKRMIVHTAIYDEFHEKFLAGMKSVRAGDPLDPKTDMGPLSSHAQRDTVIKQLAEAKKLGAKLVGGDVLPGPGAHISAGILTDLPVDSTFNQEEIFGPVAMLYRGKDLDDIIAIANNIPFGLGAAVWTNDTSEKDRFIRDIQSGMLALNQMLASSPEAPFGGIKRSGYGRELGPYGLHEFMNLKVVMVKQ